MSRGFAIFATRAQMTVAKRRMACSLSCNVELLAKTPVPLSCPRISEIILKVSVLVKMVNMLRYKHKRPGMIYHSIRAWSHEY
jgi:hypothetical protein